MPTRTERLDDYKKALVLDPNDPEALLWLGYHYAVSGRPDLARALMDRLQQVDPLTSVNLTMYGMVAMFDGNYPEALTWTQRSVDIDPANPTPRMMHALMLAANGRRDEGVAMLDAWQATHPPWHGRGWRRPWPARSVVSATSCCVS